MVAIAYATGQLERECTTEREMKRRYPALVKSIKLRIAELRAADSVDALRLGPGRWEPLRADRLGQWSGRLSGNWRLIVEPEDDGSRVRVVEIIDYH